MFRRTVPHHDDDDRKDIFGPVADLMVGVVFIFIILTIALSLNLREEQGVPYGEYVKVVQENGWLKDQNAKLVAENGALAAWAAELTQSLEAERNRAEGLAEFARFVKESKVVPLMDRLSRADETRTRLLEDIRRRLIEAGIDVTIDPSTGTMRLPSGRLFDSGRADPTRYGRETILRLGAVLAESLPCYAGDTRNPAQCPERPDFSTLSAVYVEGHTDAAPVLRVINNFRDNWDLSAARAIEAFKILREGQGVLRDLRNPEGEALLGVSGYAETRPADRLAVNRLADTMREQDRRIEVRITMATDRQAIGSVLKELNRRLIVIDGLIR